MAKLIAPLMSFGARGQIGKAIVYSIWKGISTARQLVTPKNPRSNAQLAQRALMSAVVAAWRRPALTSDIRNAWDRLAALASRALSGFNLFASNLVQLAAEDPDASIASAIDSSTEADISIGMLNMDDGATGDEAGNFSVAYGVSPTQLVYGATVAIVTGSITFDSNNLVPEGAVLYVSVRKAGTGTTVYDRSGIIAVTIET